MYMPTIVVKIYANWCGHCQSLKPEWNKMKKMIKKNKNIQIVEIEEQQQNKLNKLKQRFPNLQVNGYPTIFKIQPNKQIEYYTGNRITNDMKKWAVEKNARTTKKMFSQNRHNNTKRQLNFFGY